ncbi:3-methyl-2-oxobutanoate hydroxymethyltransferase (plasmid) [Vibrio coralliilyticus OCN008]|uniref:3-methyl-2-oxobutanoate hydroxymethyltransferase n=1 Tax=Vibrio coralliilyticus TaxID=190893 RepID=UPI0013F42824|nr:3-methyl-2-oxobutanoate hydroxymethyltransferase [Vibrio coralliilyticus]QIJ87604.1 3-methyl-2-oxobutanoate hydroxymethyltransferase [Vibrio coralliilyticus OCN008]
MKKITIKTLREMKAKGEKFSCITSYDATFTHAINEAGAETILVGDALGMVVQGHESTVPVKMSDMVYHTEAVARGNKSSLIMADLPFMAYSNKEQALANATALMQAGAHMVKMEGGAWLSDIIASLTTMGVPVCAHMGLTPQSINTMGGYRVHGKSVEEADAIKREAKELENAGTAMLVLECVPTQLAKEISEELSIPVIGIGAGADTDGQVLVLHDLLGLSTHTPKFVKNFMQGQDSIQGALSAFVNAVKHRDFPEEKHTYC